MQASEAPGAHAGEPRTVGDGPYERLILRRAILIDGSGAPPYGPVDIVIERNRITALWVHPPLGGPRLQPPEPPRCGPDGKEIDLDGKYVLPGFVDAHGHIGWPGHVPNAQYVYDLWLAHGVTTVREPGCFINGLEFVARESERSNRNEIAAPRILPYAGFGLDRQAPFETPQDAAKWVQEMAESGAQGLKLWGYRAEILHATIEEARGLGLGTMCHHQQLYVADADALQTARWGLDSIEHWYGIPEAMLSTSRLQRFPATYNYQRERARFAEAGQLWSQAARPGSQRWNDTVDAFVQTGVTLDPTFGVYVGLRDAVRVQRQPWHEDYTAETLWRYWQPDSGGHGSFFEDWGTEEEGAWRVNMRLWMDFVAEFYARGGRVTAGTDPGSIFTLFGFAYPQELELLREAGLSALEVLRSATLEGARLLGMEGSIGIVEPGKLADLVVLDRNPLADLKAIYADTSTVANDTSAVADGTSTVADDTSTVANDTSAVADGTSTRGVKLTVKDGILYDPAVLLRRVRDAVRASRDTVRADRD
jgi:Amidohydrolase family